MKPTTLDWLILLLLIPPLAPLLGLCLLAFHAAAHQSEPPAQSWTLKNDVT